MIDDLVSPLKVISVFDPAIDRSGSDLDDYLRTRDTTKLKLHAGIPPTYAVLRPLTISEFGAADAISGDNGKWDMAFRFACTAVEGAEARGLALVPTARASVGGAERVFWGDPDMAKLVAKLGARFVYEMGKIACDRAFQGNAWGGGVVYMPPPSFWLVLEQMRRPLAEPSPAPAGTPSSERSPEGSTPSPAASSAGAGDASAASSEGAPAAP